jgi:hypothetical protein
VTTLKMNVSNTTQSAMLSVFRNTGLLKMIHPISNDYIFEVYKYRVISDTSTKRATVEVLSLTL